MASAADDAMAAVREGRACFDAGDMAGAEAAFLKAHALFPNNPAVLHALGRVRMELADPAGAERLLREALAQARERPQMMPLIEAHLGQALLDQQRYAEGFRLLDRWREVEGWRETALPDLPIPRWDGGPLDGRRLLVIGEEGLGDQILYARFMGLLQARGAEVVWAGPPPLASLFRDGLGVEVVDPAMAAVSADVWIGSSALPVALMPELAAPPPAPYLRAPEPRALAGARIGLTVRGNPNNWADRYRSLPQELAAQLLALPGAISLDPAVTGAKDFRDTAAIIAGLELVISVDTSVANLAGALGAPLWVLLPTQGIDWRWGRRGEATPWYGTARLFRQSSPGNWAPIVNEVIRALA